MSDFKPLNIEDRGLFYRYLGNYPFNTYEYSFITLYEWKDYCGIEFSLVHDALIIKKTEEKKGSYFMQPLGYTQSSLPTVIDKLKRIRQKDSSFRCLFGDVEEPFLNQLLNIYGQDIIYSTDEGNSDYLYNTDKLVNLTGDRMHKKKNLVNQFTAAYDYAVNDIRHSNVAGDCIRFAEEWLNGRKIKYRELVYELNGIKNIMSHLDRLNVCGVAVYISGTVAGFTIGEKVNRDMAIIHTEKGDARFIGIYAFINHVFISEYFQDTKLINRQEDLGIAMLRKAKNAYGPLRLEKKYIVDFK